MGVAHQKKLANIMQCLCPGQAAQDDILACSQSNLKMVAGSFYVPKKNELSPLGEDAHFVCNKRQTIGLADGVSGWAKKGIDGGKFARELMRNCFFMVQGHPKGTIDPHRVLNKAFLVSTARGSSTACIITLTGDVLHANNLGDSGFVVVRAGHIVYQSPVQQTQFNCPYQLGKTTKHGPKSAMKISVEVEDGDIVIAGTDGLFNNLFPNEIEEVVKLPPEARGDRPELLACTIARSAWMRSRDKSIVTPFRKAASEAGRPELVGGKCDDITVIVAFIRA